MHIGAGGPCTTSAETVHHCAGLHAPSQRSMCTVSGGIFNYRVLLGSWGLGDYLKQIVRSGFWVNLRPAFGKRVQIEP